MLAFDFLDIKGHVGDSVLDVEPEQRVGGRERFARQHRDDVKRIIVVPEQPHGTEHALACPTAAPSAPVSVMQMRRAVEADPDPDIMSPEEIDPMLVKKSTIGLNAVGDANVRAIETIDKIEHCPVIIDPGDERLAGVPQHGEAIGYERA